MKLPMLNPPCSGWAGDLPTPFEDQTACRYLGEQTPNYQGPIYLELPRSTTSPRGVLFIIHIILSLFYIPLLAFIFFVIPPSMMSLLGGGTLLLAGAWSASVGWELDVCPPRDQPIRFNRIRQKIYAYNFINKWWNPFTRGVVIPVSYDWSQVRAERWSQTGVVAGGLIFKWGVVLSIVEPGTNKVIDRFNLSAMDTDGHTWAYICTYMQEGPHALPPPGPPKDHNDLIWWEFALRLAPKVSWPPDMDLESRTAP